jgi:hypothetical protein
MKIMQFPLSLKILVCLKNMGITPPIIINNYCILNKARPQQNYVQYEKGWNSFEICYL